MSSAAIPINTCWRCGGILECTEQTDELGRVIWDCPRCTREIEALRRGVRTTQHTTRPAFRRVFTTEDCARFLGVSPQRIRDYVKAGMLDSMRSGQIYLIPEPSAEQILTIRRQQAQQPA